MNTLKIEGDFKSWFSLLTLQAVDGAPIWNSRGRCTSTSLSSVLGGQVWNVRQPRTGFNNCNTILSCRVDFCLLHYLIHLRSYSAFLCITSFGLWGGVRKNSRSELNVSSSLISSRIEASRFSKLCCSLF